jgi:hypothetical protein
MNDEFRIKSLKLRVNVKGLESIHLPIAIGTPLTIHV